MKEAFLGVFAGFVICWALLVVCIRRSYRQRLADEQLNAPLLGEYVLCWACVFCVMLCCTLLTTLVC